MSNALIVYPSAFSTLGPNSGYETYVLYPAHHSTQHILPRGGGGQVCGVLARMAACRWSVRLHISAKSPLLLPEQMIKEMLQTMSGQDPHKKGHSCCLQLCVNLACAFKSRVGDRKELCSSPSSRNPHPPPPTYPVMSVACICRMSSR